MELTHRMKNNICIIRITGEMFGGDIQVFRAYFAKLLETELPVAFIVDLRESTIIYSTGIGVIMELFQETQKRQIGFAISQPAALTNKIFEKLKLNKILSIFDTEEDAVASFQS
ncbi:MAG: STAS domain-containing protein [SAR324 cluster bacterium]|nr:STAS domain-containing protein [SAR324 cluster bacterium]